MTEYAIAWHPQTNNLGDDLRTLAAMQLLPRVNRVLNADCLDEPIPGLSHDDRVITLLCGNTFRETAHWLPEKHVAPVCVGVHISHEDVWGIPFEQLDGAGKGYLAACAPIGCRDERTASLLEKMGIPHQLTACVTLTLQRPQVEKGGYICCVDVPEEVRLALVDACSGDIDRVRILTHHMDEPSPDFDTRMDSVKALLSVYAGAEFVITRRLHCATACLAIGTPVLLIYNNDVEDVSRFAPMDSMVRTMPVETFLHQVKAEGFPRAWVNPKGGEAWQEKIHAAVEAGLSAAEKLPLPLVQEDVALAWLDGRLKVLAQHSAQKIRQLEYQQYKSLHEKFSIILKEDAVKGSLTALMAEKEMRIAMEKLSRRQLLQALPWHKRPAAWFRMKLGQLKAEDLHQHMMDQLSALGWPEQHP